MSVSYEMDFTRASQRKILWDETRIRAATLLALGHNKSSVAEEVNVTRATIYNWLDDPEFAAEVDRLSVMTGVSSRAERLRIAMRIVRQRTDEDGNLRSDKDLLDWLKFAQSETDGAKIDMSKLAELLAGESGAGDGPSGLGGSGPTSQLSAGAIETSAVESGGSGSGMSQSQSDEDMLINPS